MLTLLKYDPLFRRTHRACFLAVLLSALFLPAMNKLKLLGSSTPEVNVVVLDGSILTIFLATIAMHAILINLQYFSIKERMGELERSLPVTFRSVYLQRMLSMWIVLAAPLLTTSVLIAMFLGFGEGARGLIPSTGKVFASLTAGVVVLFAWSPSSFSLGTLKASFLAFAASLVVLIPHFIDMPGVLYFHMAISIIGIWWILVNLPKGMIGDASVQTSSASPEADAPVWSRFMSPMQWVILRGTALRPSTTLVYILGTFILCSSAGSGSSFFLWFSCVMVFQGVTHGLALLNGLDSLPMSRAKLSPYLLLPSLVLVVSAFGFSNASTPQFRWNHPFSNTVQFDNRIERSFDQKKDYGSHLLVPKELWRWTSSTKDQVITSPWGEVTTPLLHPILPGFQFSAYNPFDVDNTNTIRFAAWQLSRALTKVYGTTLTADEVHQRWYSEFDPQSTIGENYEFTKLKPIWAESPPGQAQNQLGSVILAGILIWFMTGLYSTRRNVPCLTIQAERSRKWAFRFMLLVLFALFMGMTWLFGRERVVGPTLGVKLHSSLDSLLGSSSIAWVVLSLGVAAVFYKILSTRILRLEVPTLPKNGWSKKEISIF